MERLHESLREFQSYLSERVAPLRVVNACDFLRTNEQWQLRRDGQLLRQCGVYFMFDADGEVIYVGVASWLDKRIWSQTGRQNSSGGRADGLTLFLLILVAHSWHPLWRNFSSRGSIQRTM